MEVHPLVVSSPCDKRKDDTVSSSTAAEDTESDGTGSLNSDIEDLNSASVLSGIGGKALADEFRRWMRRRACRGSPSATTAFEVGVSRFYDGPLGALFNFIYDVLQLSSGRDKLCAFIQGFAQFAGDHARPESEQQLMYRGIEDSLSEGRKIFRLFKEIREVYKIRRGMNRLMEGIESEGIRSIPATCGALDTLGHTASFVFYLYDNILWAASIGIIRSKEVPFWQKKMWHGFRKNGWLLNSLGGVEEVWRKKNVMSICRIICALTANSLLLFRATKNCQQSVETAAFQGADDPRLFHSLEILGMASSFRCLLHALGYAPTSNARLGLLTMIAASVGIWSNWRKVCKDNCGTKQFLTSVARRSSISTPDMRRLSRSKSPRRISVG